MYLGMSHPIDRCRYLCSELVHVLYEDHTGNTHQAVANLEEISSAEAILLVEEKPPSGLPISFSAKNHDLYGVVESSHLHPILGWFIKVKLDRSSRWHGRMFVPEHFIALCRSTSYDVTEDVTSRVR
jgi:hypothetical protein